MSTFNGYIPEIPYVGVDRFEKKNKNSKMFFLSHCHTDHLVGLGDEKLRNVLLAGDVYLYATSISLRIIKNKFNFTTNLKELPIGKPYSISVPSQYGQEEKYLCVTTIPAGHCPGSVMFLFETEGKSILYTGDFRINAKDLHKYGAFHDEAGHVKKLDALYLDTTFCSPVYEHFPPRKDSVDEICKLVEEWITASDNHIIDLHLPSYYGSEYLFEEIFKRTNARIHVLEEDYNLYKYMPGMAKIINTGTARAKIHTRLNYKNACCATIKNPAYFMRTIRPSAIVWEDMKSSDEIVDRSGQNYYRVCYSNHASFSEIREFVRYLKPFRIEPCVVPDDFNERSKLFCSLDAMRNEYVTRENEGGSDTTEQFPLIGVGDGGEIERVEPEQEFDLLSPPPKRFCQPLK